MARLSSAGPSAVSASAELPLTTRGARRASSTFTTSFRSACSTTTAAPMPRSDPVLPGDYLDVHVRDGWVTVKGDVDHQYQSDAAYEHVAGLDGITGITNAIKVIERR